MKIVETSMTSKRFQETVANAIDEIPAHIKARLIAANVEIRTGALLTDCFSDLSGTPEGWPSGTNWASVGGVHRRENGASVIGVSEYLKSNVAITKSKQVAGALRHEIGHAWDFAAIEDTQTSQSARFLAAYRDDISRMGPLDRMSLRSFLHPQYAGPREVFAEAFAVLMGGGSGLQTRRDTVFRNAFPNCLKVASVSLVEGLQP